MEGGTTAAARRRIVVDPDRSGVAVEVGQGVVLGTGNDTVYREWRQVWLSGGDMTQPPCRMWLSRDTKSGFSAWKESGLCSHEREGAWKGRGKAQSEDALASYGTCHPTPISTSHDTTTTTAHCHGNSRDSIDGHRGTTIIFHVLYGGTGGSPSLGTPAAGAAVSCHPEYSPDDRSRAPHGDTPTATSTPDPPEETQQHGLHPLYVRARANPSTRRVSLCGLTDRAGACPVTIPEVANFHLFSTFQAGPGAQHAHTSHSEHPVSVCQRGSDACSLCSLATLMSWPLRRLNLTGHCS